jgi:hypothetical protein
MKKQQPKNDKLNALEATMILICGIFMLVGAWVTLDKLISGAFNIHRSFVLIEKINDEVQSLKFRVNAYTQVQEYTIKTLQDLEASLYLVTDSRYYVKDGNIYLRSEVPDHDQYIGINWTAYTTEQE